MPLQPREEFNRWIHSFGVTSNAVLCAMMIGFPLAVSAYYNLWPSFKTLLPSFATVVLILAPYWPAELISYMPVMGPGSLYMSYITGNVTNLRMPVTIGTINILGIKPGTDECHVMSLIACGASVITSTVILALGIFAAMVLAPVLQSPALKPAFDYVVPALFGGLVAQTILKSKKDFVVYIPALAVNLIFCYFTKINGAYYMLIGLVLAVAFSVAEYKKHKKQPE
ncbi:MAG: hypothetical protein LBI74_09260 [Synergistaceae bacterium]|jgi:hypothetical protein|nr:hypothetical protein [Synergistaceae bacterium]